jgi:hypothetical protein
MPSINPGPAVTSTQSSEAVLTPVNTLGTTAPPQAANQLRLMGSARGVPVSNLGDAALIQIINTSSWLPVNIVTANALVNGVSGTIATASIGLFTAANAGGTAIKAAAALAGNTSQAAGVVAATTVVAVSQTVQNIYVNVAVVVAGGTVDVFLYGYDLS